jgi:hypothetical protein
MKIFIFIILLTGNIISVYSQSGSTYTFRYSKNIECAIMLYSKSVYIVELFDFGDTDTDATSSAVLSYGTYSIQNGKLICTDKYNDFKFIFAYNTKYVQSISFLNKQKNKVIYLSNHYSVNSKSKPEFIGWNWDTLFKPLKQACREFDKSQKTFLNFQPGLFEFDRGYDCTLNLTPDNLFELKIFKVVISKGKWSRKGNKIELYDEALKTSFYAFIESKKLRCRILSLDNNGFLLDRKR